ncbi:hypothetical protein ACFOTA_22650 [Chitinophaga sp. GCM10012297]|uniref:Uncharacterized protein n=1 Tax=Chitinophaga chungangae TaxID=2821488 RepID=A0ABS3YK25_9BACT|nr:hypothetical protein [Chitinophaga chungangae]MBO9155031.1 hypothetical protein [Chitinophaga chungangae]
MRKSLRIATFVMASLLFFSYNKLKAQVKIGGDPAFVDPNAILELESNRKGFLLPRLDATGYTFLKSRPNVSQGMVIYLKAGAGHPNGAGFYFKTGTGNTDADWTKMQEDDGTSGGPWKLGGNANADANSFIGTTILQPLKFKANNLDVMSFATDGKLTIPYANVGVAASGVNDVLMIGSDGLIQKQNLSLTSVTSLNTVKGDAVLGGAVSASATGITAAATGQNVNLTFPTMTGAAGQTYGFITKADWDKLANITSASGITVADVAAAAAAGNAPGKIEKGTGPNDGKWTLTLYPASEDVPGVVTTGAQTFKGLKTFDGDIAITNVNGGTAGLTMDGSLKLGLTPNASATATTFDVLVKDGSAGGEVKKITMDKSRLTGGISAITDPTNTDATAAPATGKLGFVVGNTGTDFSIVSNTNTVTFNIPDANATNRGLITNAAQNIAGVKTFNDQVIAAKNLTVGGTDATSGININGSVMVKVTTLPGGGGTVADNDYIVLVSGNGSATVPVTIPAADAANKGRIYIIKRTAAASPASEISIVQISANGQNISGRATIDIDEPYFSVTLISMGTTWEVLSRSATNF